MSVNGIARVSEVMWVTSLSRKIQIILGISVGLASVLRTRVTDRISSLVHECKGTAILTNNNFSFYRQVALCTRTLLAKD
jgi:hypothetical protein